jgi:hypothetical protein
MSAFIPQSDIQLRVVLSLCCCVLINLLIIISVYSSKSDRRRATVLESPEQQNVFPLSIFLLLNSSVLVHEGPKSDSAVWLNVVMHVVFVSRRLVSVV